MSVFYHSESGDFRPVFTVNSKEIETNQPAERNLLLKKGGQKKN